MGAVYRARDTNFRAVQLVAVKEMITQVSDPMVRKNIFQIFEREANILVTLRHPAIPRIYDYFTIGERAYLVMEFIHGKNIDQILSEASEFFPEEQVIAWAIELCDVLQYLHGHKPEPIIYRDIKPSNIMINQQNQVILVDFGIAKVFEAGSKNTMVGTQGYSPPEQYRGEATPKVDIYAMGATLHHVITFKDPRLEAPFTFKDRPIENYNQDISPEFQVLIERALEYNPDDRFDSAQEMKEALIAAARKTGTLLYSTLGTIPIATRTHSQSITPIWTFECEDDVRGTPAYYDSKLYVGSYDHNLYCLNAANGEFIWKYPTEGGIPGKPALDTDSVYVGSEDQRMHVISQRTGKLEWTHYTDGPIRSSPKIAEGHVFIGSDDRYLHAVNLATRRLSWRFEAGAPIRSTPFITHERIYFGSEDGEFTCLDFRGKVKWRYKSKRAITSSPVIDGDVVYFSSMDNMVYALDAQTGYVIWRFRMGKGSISSPYVLDEDLFVGSSDKDLYCIDVKSSREKWRFNADNQVNGSPVIYNDAIYFGCVSGNLYCLEHKTGRLRWKYATEGPITGTPVIQDEILYFGSTDNFVYALHA